jgi:phenylacetaldehyde dehydrogenase
VLKPAEQTPLTALRFAQLVSEAGIPDGVVNVVTGYGHTAGAALVDHPGVDKISFTGSTEVGKLIAVKAAAQFKKYTLELGGKSPVIVMDDANLDIAIPGAAWAIFGNHGQNCCAGSRLYVHRNIYDRVIEGVATIAKAIKLGPGLDPTTEMGPLVSKEQQERVLGYVQSGVEQGAEIVVGGKALDHPGFYVEPTVLANTRHDMKVVQEEIFGPVLVASPFDDIEEVLVRANGTRYGLGASLWTENIGRMHRLVPRLRAGTVWVNTHNVLDLAMPFGGLKDSGVGSELSEEAIYQHTQIKSVIVNI